MKKTLRVAAAQIAPVYLNLHASVARACDTIQAAGGEGAELVVFPETFLPGYPYFVITHDPTETTPFLTRLRENAVEIPSPATERLCKAARDAAKEDRSDVEEGVDPDLVGMKPGPQPAPSP